MKIVVCSKNKAKNDAVENVIKRYYEDYDIISLETDSSVSETPIDDDEGIRGCHNRINSAISQDNEGDLYIAMEGILTKTNYGTFICGWTVVFDKYNNKYCYGCSAKVKVPDEIVEKTTIEERLSDTVAKHFRSTGDEVSKFGTNGILTRGAYTRTDEFIDSLLCAISTMYN